MYRLQSNTQTPTPFVPSVVQGHNSAIAVVVVQNVVIPFEAALEAYIADWVYQVSMKVLKKAPMAELGRTRCRVADRLDGVSDAQCPIVTCLQESLVYQAALVDLAGSQDMVA